MSLDISRILADWPFESGQVSARRIKGDDGREKIQFRMDLGLIQMESQGRPDGQRPYGFESLLDYHENQLRCFRQDNGTDDGFALDEDECQHLRAESNMYYQRYLAEFVLEDFEAVERDTTRNLRLFDFCGQYASQEADRYILEQYRPYVIMMCTRSRAKIALRDNRPRAALALTRKGLEDIRHFFRRFGQEKEMGASSEVVILKALCKEIEALIPPDPIQQLKRRLAQALEKENYEEAARLRDQINQAIKQTPLHGAHKAE